MKDLKEIPSVDYADNVLKVIQLTVQKVLSDPQMLSSLISSSNQAKTIGSLCADYKTHLKEFGYSPKYQISIKATLNKAEFVFGPEKPIHEITSKHVEEFILFCKRKAPAGWYVDFRNLRTLFSKAVQWGYLKDNPCKKVKLLKEQKQKRDYLTFSDLQTVLSFVQLQVLKDIYLFAFHTALRLSEIINLRWSDVSINDKTITIGNSSFITKSRKIRIITLSNEAAAILQQRFPKIINASNDFVFIKKDGTKYSNDFVSKSFKRYLRKSGIQGKICFHSLRHSAISHALNNGAPLSAVKEFAGHSNIQTTQNYLHTNLEDLRKVSQTFNIAVGDIMYQAKQINP